MTTDALDLDALERAVANLTTTVPLPWHADSDGDVYDKAENFVLKTWSPTIAKLTVAAPTLLSMARRAVELEKALADPALQPPWLPDLLTLFGWQGGTYTQALQRVRGLVAMERAVAMVADALDADEVSCGPATVAARLRALTNGDGHGR